MVIRGQANYNSSLLLVQQFLLIASMKGQLQSQHQFSSLKEEEYRLFNPRMFQNINYSTQAPPQSGDKQQFYQMQHDFNIITNDLKKHSNHQSIIDRFNNQDQPFLEQKDHSKHNNALNLTYSKLRDSNLDINDPPLYRSKQKQSPITDKKNNNYSNQAQMYTTPHKHTLKDFIGGPTDQQKQHLIRNLQHKTKERQKYSQSFYFSKKDRNFQNKEIQQIFDTHKEVAQNIRQSKPQRSQIKTPQKPCKFCDASNIKLHRQQIQAEARANKISYSPARFLHQKYFNQDDKLNLQPRIEYLQQGRLKAQYLQNISQSIDRELSKLNKWKLATIKSNQSPSTVRKKIFQDNILPSKQTIHIRIEDQQTKPKKFSIVTPETQKTSKSKKKDIYRNIFVSISNKRQAQSKKNNGRSNSLDFDYIKTSLIDSRIKTFNNKNSKIEEKNIPAPISKSPERLFSSPFKKETAEIYANMNINTDLRKWINQNKLSISTQTQKILRYELIRRYLAKQQIEQRLRQMVEQKMKPKRWLLTLVDEVYSRLKNRYFPN